MGSGKSYLGIRLATRLGRPFVDLDSAIETGESMTITKIFSDRGEAAFRRLEASYLRRIEDPSSVVATGGGAPCFHGGIDYMNDRGITVFLDPSVEILYERLLQARAHRPLLQNDRELKQLIERKLSTRRPIYESAKIHLTYDDPDGDVLTLLTDRLEKSYDVY